MEPEIAAAAGILVELGRSLGLSPVLIGALASEAAPDRPSGAPPSRATLDADFAIQIPDWPTYDVLMKAIVKAGHRRDPHVEHRVYIRDIMIDLVPFGSGVVPDGRNLTWISSGFVMDVTGLLEAAESAREVMLSPAVRLNCITLPAFTLLKASAYLDRQRSGKPKYKTDAGDLLFWFQHYASGDRDDVRYEMIAQGEISSIDYFTAGAAALGRDAFRLGSPAARQRLLDLIGHARSDDSPFWSVLNRPSFTEEDTERTLKEGRGLLEAFAWGVSSVQDG